MYNILINQASLFRPLLLKKEKRNVKQNDKLLKWSFIVISIGVSLLGAVYLLCFSVNTKIQPEFNDDTKVHPSSEKRNP